MRKKSLLYAVVAAGFWLTLNTAHHAQTGTPEFDPLGEHDSLPKQIRVQVEFIDVAHEQLTELMFGEKPPANDAELRKQAGQLVKDGKATILETLLCTSKSGQKSTSESIEEVIYPTEYEPAQVPEEPDSKDKEVTDKAKATRLNSAVGPTPTAFATRNVGSTLEIEPTLAEDNKTIDLRFIPEMVYHVGNQIWAEWKGEHGNSPIQMPTFYCVRLNSSVTLSDGKPMFVASLSPKKQDGTPDFSRKLMVFVRADVITTGR